MSPQIAVRIPEEELQELDRAVAAGEFESRAAAVRNGLRRLLDELREREVARQYRQAYGRHADDPEAGEAGAALLAEAIGREEAERG